MKRALRLACLFVLVFLWAPTAQPDEKTSEIPLPASCAPGWVADGKPATYTPANLYKYIDGEAELYLPYGFEKAQSVMYVDPVHKGNGLVASVFKMGSLLDAFGIYGNYRGSDVEGASVGAEGFIEESQLMFYQGRYFVQIAASGSVTEDPSLFLACASEISKHLPGDGEKPKEIAYLRVPGLVPSTERYYADGLLGYGFFGRGLTGEVMLRGAKVKVFLMLADSSDGAKGAVDAYVNQLKRAKAAWHVSPYDGGLRLTAADPLYKGLVLRQSGRFAAGVVGLVDPRDGDGLVARLIEGLPE